MAEYHYDPYRSPYVGSIADLMGRGGDIQAQAALRAGDIRSNAVTNVANIQANQMMQSGANWGNALNQVGQTIAAIPAEMQQQKFRSAQLANIQAESDRRAAEAAAMQRDQRAQTLWSQALKSSVGDDGVVDHQKAAYMLSKAGYPVQANAYLEAAQKTQITAQQISEGQRKVKEGQDLIQKASVNHLGELAAVGLSKLDKSTPLEARDTITGLVANAASHGLITEDDARQFLMRAAQAGPDQLRNLYQGLLDSAPEVKDKLLKGRLTESEIAKNEAAATKPPATKGLQSENEWMVDGKSTPVIFDPATGNRYLTGDDVAKGNAINPSRLRKIPPASTIINPQVQSDVSETVKGMKDGTLPPILPGRATKEYTALMAEAHRQGYDLAGAATDWAATQRHIATLNGSQQLRLNQAINSLPEMLDNVDALASKWQGGKFPVLNRANLALAKGGAYGKEAASIANQLDAQIADVTADLGNVYMGGNSPTDQALQLAGKSLKGEWDEKVLHDMVNLARKNVGIRKNSINSTGVSGASANNPYAPKASTETPSPPPNAQKVTRGPDGKLIFGAARQ